MNIVIGALGANLTLGLISGVSSTAKSVYDLIFTIKNRTNNGAEEIKQIIQDIDLEGKIKTTQFFLSEIRIDNDTPYTVIYCADHINDAIMSIVDELNKIYQRMQYNNNIWIGSSVRAYKFHNCTLRIKARLDILEERKKSLIDILSVQHKMYKNDKIKDQIGQLTYQIDSSNDQNNINDAALIRGELHKKIEYIGIGSS
jgi:hypothetical protein